MKVRNANYEYDVHSVFDNARFIRELGIQCTDVGAGSCRAEVTVQPQHLQHLDRVHGGVVSSLAGHAALGAAISVVPEGEILVAPEFTFKMFRAVDSGLLQARATVIKAGAVLVFTESEILQLDENTTHMVAKGTFTFTRVKRPKG